VVVDFNPDFDELVFGGAEPSDYWQGAVRDIFFDVLPKEEDHA